MVLPNRAKCCFGYLPIVRRGAPWCRNVAINGEHTLGESAGTVDAGTLLRGACRIMGESYVAFYSRRQPDRSRTTLVVDGVQYL
jgi:hypothetical protein